MIKKAISITKMPVFKAIITLSIPIIMANLFQALYQLTDSFWVGRLGGTALAAVSICSPVIFLSVSLGIGLAMAGSTFVAQYYGAKNQKMLSHSAAQTVLMVVFVSFFITLLGILFSPSILHFMGAKDDFYNMALSFINISFLATISNFSFFVFQSFMRGVGRAQVPVFIVIATVVLNFILDPLFIFGYGPIPSFGPAGAAFATLLTQTIAAIIGFVILFSGKHGIHLHFSDFKPDYKFIKKAIKIGVPSSVEQSSRSLSMVVMTALITSFGTVAVASYGAGGNLLQIAMFIGIGLAVATGTLVGQNIGANNIAQAIKVSRLGATISFISLSFIGLISLIFSRQFISFFVPNDIEVINTATTFIKYIAVGFGFIGLQMSFGNVFLAAGKSSTTMIITISSQWLFQIPLAYFLSKHTPLGIHGVWLAFPANSIITSIVTAIIYLNGSWQKGRIIEDDKLTGQVGEEVLVEEGIR